MMRQGVSFLCFVKQAFNTYLNVLLNKAGSFFTDRFIFLMCAFYFLY